MSWAQTVRPEARPLQQGVSGLDTDTSGCADLRSDVVITSYLSQTAVDIRAPKHRLQPDALCFGSDTASQFTKDLVFEFHHSLFGSENGGLFLFELWSDEPLSSG